MKRPDGWRIAGSAVLLVLAIFAVYARVWSAGFIWDDDAHVTANPVIIGPLGLKEIWTSAKANYFPLTMTSFWVQHALWGLEPALFHGVVVAFQAASAVLLYLVLRRLQVPGAALGAALWALHPVQVESVAWISELKNTQASTFFLLAIWFFLRWLEAGGTGARWRDYGLAWICAVLAILSKASTVMLPVILGLVWWWRGGWSLRGLRWLVPFLLVSAAASGWTIWEQKVNSMASGPDWHLSFAQRAVLAGRVVWFYLGKLAWPESLIFIYPRWEIEAGRWIWWGPLLALVVTAVALTAARGGRARPWFFAGAYFAISLFPVLGLFDVFFFRYSYVADHFQHLASIGPLALAGAGLALGVQRLPGVWGGGRLLAAVAPVAGLALLSWHQTALYRDSLTLWRDTADRNPRAWIARVNLGYQLTTQGRLDEAIAHYRVALELRPGAPEILTNLGGALLQQGRAAEAVPHLEAAVRANPRMHEAWNALGLALVGVGRRAEGRQAYEAALARRGDFVPALYNLANVRQQEGDTGGARALLEQALRLAADPNSRYAAQRRLGELLAAAGQPAEAAAMLEGVVQVRPEDPELRELLALVCCQAGRWAEAAVHFAELVARRPGSAAAQSNLGSALVQIGRAAEAVPRIQEALRLDPGLTDARANLAVALARLGRTAEARAECALALQAQPAHPVARRLWAELGEPAAR